MSAEAKDEIIGKSEKHPIILLPYDNTWPEKFEAEKSLIKQALGPKAIRIDHIGSTAIPHLGAKPIIDITISVEDIAQEDLYLPALISAGYELRIRSTEHHMLRSKTYDPSGHTRTVNLHICRHGGVWERKLLLFRDYLRSNAPDREIYFHAKTELAQHDWPNMNAYADAKDTIIADITQRAEQWALKNQWQP